MAQWVTALAVLGGLADILSFVSFGLDMEEPTQNYHIELRAGDDHYDSSGHLPLVELFTPKGERFAENKDDIWVKAGKRGWADFGGEDTSQIGKVAVKAGKNDICIAWLSIEDKGSGEKAVLLGEVLKHCGASWYPSKTTLDIENGRDVDCAWLNNGNDKCQNSEGNGDWHGFWIDRFSWWTSSYNADQRDPKDACSQIVPYRTSQCQSAPSKRDKTGDLASTITRTDRPLAQRVCDDPNSYGPSLLSKSEGLLCDMRTHTLRPLCSNGIVPNCYQDVETQHVAINGAMSYTASTDDFAPSDWDLDNEQYPNGTMVKRDSNEIVTPGSTVNYQESRHCPECCVGAPAADGKPNYNATHYWGPGVEGPLMYRNMSGGIYISRQPEGKDTTFVAQCGSNVDVTTYLSRDSNLGFGTAAVSVVGVAAMLGAGIAIVI